MDLISPSIPSRQSNPFATCWTRPGALPFRFETGQSAVSLVDELASRGWRGQIVGPHGSGKSTLLASLIREVQRRGKTIGLLSLGSHRRHLGAAAYRELLDSDVVVVDGYEQLRQWNCWRLRWHCWKSRRGLLITTHRRQRLPVLARTAPNLQTVQQLVERLTAGRPCGIDQDDVATSFTRHKGNVREIFFDLYDRYELAARSPSNHPVQRSVESGVRGGAPAMHRLSSPARPLCLL